MDNKRKIDDLDLKKLDKLDIIEKNVSSDLKKFGKHLSFKIIKESGAYKLGVKIGDDWYAVDLTKIT